jgi:uncharacterized protein YggE
MARQFLTPKLGRLVVAGLLVGCASSADEHATVGQSSGVDRPAATVAEPTQATTAVPAGSADDAGRSAVETSTAPAPIGAGIEQPPRSITVGGMGAEYGPPSRSVVDIGVSVRRPTVDEATRAAAAAGAAMIATLQAAGVPEDDIQTSQFGINPYSDQHDYTRIVGYETNIGYRVTVPDVEALGGVLARAVESGGDSVRAWSIAFAGEPADHMAAARAEAWDDVRDRAAATAAEIGEPLGEVLDVHEKVLVTSPQGMMQGGEGDSASFDIPISPGVVGVIVLLTVTYALGS